MAPTVANQDVATPKAPGEQRIDSLQIEIGGSIVLVRHWKWSPE